MPLSRQAVLRTAATLGVLGALAWACGGEEFTNFNEVDRLRVLSVRAEPPWLVATSSNAATFPPAELTALIGHGPDTSTASVRLEWSWCPLRAGSTGDEEVPAYGCALGPNQLLPQLGFDPPAPGEYPDNEFPIEVDPNTGRTLLVLPIPPSAVAEICEELSGVEVPEFVNIPSCEDGFPISIRLRATMGTEGEDDYEQVTSLKEVTLAFDPAAGRNDNPGLGKVFLVDPANPDRRIDLTTTSTNLARNTEYEVKIELQAQDAQAVPLVAGASVPDFVDPSTCNTDPEPGEEPAPRAREDLIVTWFIQGGETDAARTGWLADVCADEESFDAARTNTWTTPRKADYPATTSRLYVVVRDARRGAVFTSLTVGLKD